jgi:hypothetical protein
VKGGGNPFAALAVGSRGFGKRKTLDETRAAFGGTKWIGHAVFRFMRLLSADAIVMN